MQNAQDTTFDDLHRQAGIELAMASHGLPASAFEACQAFVDEVDDSPAFHRKTAAAVARVYEEVGLSETVSRRIFTKLAETERWSEAHRAIMDAAYAGLAKSAGLSAAVSSILQALGGGAKLTAQTISTGAGLAALLGAGAGTLNWTLGRAASENDEDTEATKARISEYQRVTREIDNEIKMRGLNRRG